MHTHGLLQLTIGFAAQQNIDPPKDLHSFGDSSSTASHGSPIASDTAYTVLPALTILSGALALIHELAKLGTAVLMIDFVGRQTCDNVIAM